MSILNKGFSEDALRKMLYDMILIRRFEEELEQSYQQGKIHGTMHLCIGQEATAVGACVHLTDDDKIISTHRGHGHCIAKGAQVDRMTAELLGKETGYCNGKGGSMHIADLDIGILGANGIVGAGMPIATGAALTSKMKDLGQVVIAFFGDGATNEGAFHEAINLASVWDLPVIFFCENNQYGMSGPVKDMVNIEHIAERAGSYGIPGEIVDGNDVLAVAEVTEKAIERARNGEGPTLIEAKTYRWRGHSRSDARKYRTRDEERDWRKNRDPIAMFKEKLFNEGILNDESFAKLEAEIEAEMAAAIKFADESKEPSLDELYTDVFA